MAEARKINAVTIDEPERDVFGLSVGQLKL